MPNLTNVVLKDRAPTPADHTFKPRDTTGGITTLVESNGVPLGDRKITLSQSRSASGRIRATVKLTLPVIQDVEVNGVVRPTVVRSNYAEFTLNFDPSSSRRERDDTVSFINELCKDGQGVMDGFLVDLEGLW